MRAIKDRGATTAGTGAVFHVHPVADIWVVDQNGRRLKLRFSVEVAVADAVKAAISTFNKGVPSQVLFDSGRETQTLWRNGRLTFDSSDVLERQRVEAPTWAA